MRAGSERNRGLAPLLILFVLLAVVILPQLDELGGRAPTAPPSEPPLVTATDWCLSERPYTYYADDPFGKGKESPDSFGSSLLSPEEMQRARELRGTPELQTLTVPALTELEIRLCGNADRGGDPVLYRALESAAFGHYNPNRQPSRTEHRETLELFMTREALFSDAFLAWAPTEPDELTMVMRGSGPDIIIDAVTAPERESLYLMLPVRTGEGTKLLKLRVVCGAQPYGLADGFPPALL